MLILMLLTALQKKEPIGRHGKAVQKDKPAKGEYMIGQTASSVLVQISPASYDLSGKTVKAVNTQG